MQAGADAGVRDTSPGWTPAGDVVFSSETAGSGKSDIVIADRSGGAARPLVESPGEDGGAAFSRDGRQLAFHSDRSGNFEIYVAKPDGSAAKPVTNDPAVDQMPAWSPDGRKIAFMSNRAGKDFDVYTMNADGSGVERLTTVGSSGFPEYSSDGGQLLLQVGRDACIMTLSTRGLRRLTHEPTDGTHPTWSPDGQFVAFASSRNGRGEIFTAKVAGNEDARRLVALPTGDAVDPRWSPDGQYITFVQVPSGAAKAPGTAGQRIVYVVEVEGGRLHRISR